MYIRLCIPEDYPSAVSIYNAMYPQRATTVQAWLEADQHRKAKYKNKVWIAFVDEAGLQRSRASAQHFMNG